LRISAAGFYNIFDNIQVRQNVPGGFLLLNAPKARTQGFDIDMSTTPIQDLTVQGAVAYLDGKYGRFPNAPFFTPIAAGGSIPASGDASGRDTVLSPHWVVSLGFEYVMHAAGDELTLAANDTYNSGFFWDPQNRLKNPSYHLLNASLLWGSKSQQWDIRIWGRNLLDRHFYVFTNQTNLGDDYNPSAPRTIGATVGFHF
jgi:iron complex outermembrane receptor protein